MTEKGYGANLSESWNRLLYIMPKNTEKWYHQNSCPLNRGGKNTGDAPGPLGDFLKSLFTERLFRPFFEVQDFKKVDFN